MSYLPRLFLALAMVFGCGALFPQESVKIYYKKTGSAENVKYDYNIINNTTKSVWSIVLGGVQSKWGIPHVLLVDPKQIFSPPEWEGIVEPMEESDNFAMRWKNPKLSNVIRPGETKGGFGVLLPKDDPEYSKGPFEVRFSEGKGFIGQISPAPEGFAFVFSQHPSSAVHSASKASPQGKSKKSAKPPASKQPGSVPK